MAQTRPTLSPFRETRTPRGVARRTPRRAFRCPRRFRASARPARSRRLVVPDDPRSRVDRLGVAPRPPPRRTGPSCRISSSSSRPGTSASATRARRAAGSTIATPRSSSDACRYGCVRRAPPASRPGPHRPRAFAHAIERATRAPRTRSDRSPPTPSSLPPPPHPSHRWTHPEPLAC